MTAFLCETCGVQHAPVPGQPDAPPGRCLICEDERQYVGRNGQRWTTSPEGLRASGRRNVLAEPEPGLTTINTVPSFAIGQQAHLIQTTVGNLLWEAVGLCDEETIAAIRARGGVAAIGISHPHFYSAMVDWSHAFGGAPIWLPSADREWVMRPDPAIHFWHGETAGPLPGSGLTLLRVGGHFAGATALLWPNGAEGSGALFSGDLPQVAADPRWVSFLYSYPNMIPLSAVEVRRIAATLAAQHFDRIYGSWTAKVVPTDGAAVVARSAERYVRHVESGTFGEIDEHRHPR
ncbi:MAG TPA: MBL fold metallo-hydrolase [Chloroflexota bacterium]|nr:MBL fold metallo-hydrolase [Chloroflexota bacterium]